MKHLLKMSDLSPAELHHILDVAEELKAEQKAGTTPALLKGRSVALMFSKNSTRTRTEKILAATPMGRFGDSEKDLVGALLFLLNNEAAGFITGICLPIDGGFSAYSGV